MLSFILLYVSVLSEYSVSDWVYGITSYLSDGVIYEDSPLWVGSPTDNRFWQ